MTTIDMKNESIAQHVVMVTLISALALEINTQNRVKANRPPNTPLAVAKRLGFTGKTKKEALVWAVGQMEEIDPTYAPGPSTNRALAA